jgi:DNA-3-methyladenine glycosylase II
MDEAAIRLATTDPFSFSECLVYLNRSVDELLHRVENEALYKVLHLENRPVLIEVRAVDDGLQIKAMNARLSEANRLAVCDYVRHWFDLDRDLRPFYQLATTDPILQPLITRHQGLRLVGIPDLFEALCWSIIGQQINLRFAYTLKRRFVENYGEAAFYNELTCWTFPKPETVADLQIADLRSMQFSGRKAEYLIGLAQTMATGGLTPLDFPAEADIETLRQPLLALRGVGRWTADYVLMKCFRHPQALPIDDVGLHNALKQALGWSRKPTVEEIRGIFAPWHGWEAYAIFYLWHSLLS